MGPQFPVLPDLCPKFWGRSRDMVWKKNGGFFGEGDMFNFGSFYGHTPKIPNNKLFLGDCWIQNLFKTQINSDLKLFCRYLRHLRLNTISHHRFRQISRELIHSIFLQLNHTAFIKKCILHEKYILLSHIILILTQTLQNLEFSLIFTVLYVYQL